MTLGAPNPDASRGSTNSSGNDRAALEGMLKSYPIDQLVEEVLIAWDELGVATMKLSQSSNGYESWNSISLSAKTKLP